MTIDREIVVRLAGEVGTETGWCAIEKLERFAAMVLEQGAELSFQQIEDCFPEGAAGTQDGSINVSAQWLHDFARAIEAAHGIINKESSDAE